MTEAELQQGIEDGLSEESQYLEVKREVGDTDGERKNTARNLASFTIHGGALIIGVEEDKKNRRWNREPQPLAGLVERVELVAANRIDPPLFLRVSEIPSEANPDEGFLFIEVPPSSQAPHMVDGMYFGRRERTRKRLSDPALGTYSGFTADLRYGPPTDH
jgi:predicted HTH transcriptional regulator